jgi:hypothetical protein
MSLRLLVASMKIEAHKYALLVERVRVRLVRFLWRTGKVKKNYE